MDEADLERLYVRLRKPVYNVVYRWLWNPEEAHDVVQEAFVRLWRMRQRVDPAKVEPLVYRIALNLAASKVRRRKRWRWLPLEAIGRKVATKNSAEQALVDGQRHTRLRAAVGSLPDDLRRIVVLCELSDLSYQQIADVLSIPAGTVGSRRHRAIRLLREMLSAETDAHD